MTTSRSETVAIWTLRFYMVTFAAVGLLFLFAPDSTLIAVDRMGEFLVEAQFDQGKFVLSPMTEQKLWLGLGFSYMMLVTGLAYCAQRDLRSSRPYLVLLMIGKAASSLAALYFFVTDLSVFAYLLNFLVDGSIVLVVLWVFVVASRAGPRAAAA